MRLRRTTKICKAQESEGLSLVVLEDQEKDQEIREIAL